MTYETMFELGLFADHPRYDEECNVDNGFCLTHGWAVSENLQCPTAAHRVWNQEQ